jgi:hypothetical protein
MFGKGVVHVVVGSRPEKQKDIFDKQYDLFSRYHHAQEPKVWLLKNKKLSLT